MRSYLKNIKHITSLMAFIAALLVGVSFATVSNAAVVPVNPVIGNAAVMPAPVMPAAAKSTSAFVNPGLGVRPFGLGVRPFGLGVRPFGFGFNPFFRPFGFGINPFFGADFDADFD